MSTIATTDTSAGDSGSTRKIQVMQLTTECAFGGQYAATALLAYTVHVSNQIPKPLKGAIWDCCHESRDRASCRRPSFASLFNDGALNVFQEGSLESKTSR